MRLHVWRFSGFFPQDHTDRCLKGSIKGEGGHISHCRRCMTHTRHPSLAVLMGMSKHMYRCISPQGLRTGAKTLQAPRVPLFILAAMCSLEPPNCLWLLAWHSPFDGTKNKVYVECGYIEIDWYKIEQKLEASGSVSYYCDPETKAEASAAIDATGTDPTLAAVYDVAN